MQHSKSHQVLALDLLQTLRQNQPNTSIHSFWTQMNASEREAFAKVLFEETKEFVLQGEQWALKAFELSIRIAPLSAKLHYKQAVFLFDYAVHKSSDRCLLLAEKHIQHAIQVNGHFFDAWYIWGDILVQLGLAFKEVSYFQQADEKYSRAHKLAKERPQYLKKFLWDWALCWCFLGKYSEEAVDIKRALEKFDQAARLGCSEPAFFKDYGNAWSTMGLMIRDHRFLEKANQFYEKATQLNPKYFEAWLASARCYQNLYEYVHLEKYLAQSHAAYSKAAELKQESFDLWMHWGDLFLFSGRCKEEVKHLQMSAMKYAKALKINADSSEALSKWGEALTILGHYTSRLDHLKEGEAKIAQALENSRECANAWYRYGFCLYSQGQYFEDSDYYLHATEKLNHALKLDPNHFYALYAMGLSQYALGDLHKDKSLLQTSSQYFAKAAEQKKNHPELYNSWGMALMRQADLLDSQELIEQAIEQYENAVQLYQDTPASTLLLYNYACALDFLASFTNDGQTYEKAAHVLEQVLKQDPDFTVAYYNLALVYMHMAELLDDIDYYNQSNDCFYRAVQDDSEDEVVWNAWGVMLIQYARLIYEPLKIDLYERIVEDAEKKLRQALSLGNLEALYNLATLQCLRGNHTESIHYLKLAYQKEALPSLEQLMYDDTLESLRQSDQFQDFLTNDLLKNKASDN